MAFDSNLPLQKSLIPFTASLPQPLAESAIRVTCITTADPILRAMGAAVPAAVPSITSCVMRTATAWNTAGSRQRAGMADISCTVQAGVRCRRCRSAERHCTAPVANALSAISAAHVRYQARAPSSTTASTSALYDRSRNGVGQCRRGQHRHHALDLRRRPGSVGARARPRRRPIGTSGDRRRRVDRAPPSISYRPDRLSSTTPGRTVHRESRRISTLSARS